jgi:hypothetical protein
VFVRSSGTWSQQGSKLTPDDEDNTNGGGIFGASVGLSGDGNSAVIGAPDDADFAGAAWLFTRSAGVWTQSAAKATAGDEDLSGFGGEFGFSVAESSDASTAIIGGPFDGEFWSGAVWAFVASAAVTPSAPRSVSAVAGNGQATVSFLPPLSDGGATISSYTVTASPGGAHASGSGSPIAVTGLTNGSP